MARMLPYAAYKAFDALGRDANFVAVRRFHEFAPGDLIDKSKFNTRTLRSLFMMGRIRPATDGEAVVTDLPIIKHLGWGKWAVFDEGKKLSKGTAKQDAIAALAVLQAQKLAA